jgi:hypothetical protein
MAEENNKKRDRAKPEKKREKRDRTPRPLPEDPFTQQDQAESSYFRRA